MVTNQNLGVQVGHLDNGISAVTEVPSPGLDTMSNLPPNNAARSFIPRVPVDVDPVFFDVS